jgi:4-amino-4-deoxy-L-arabinose transferase-like glycosyltransferase
VLTWVLPVVFFQHTIELDGLEQLVWSSTLEMGYYKHPPFPTWVTYLFTHLFGENRVSMFALGMISVGLSLWFVWRLASTLLPWRDAALAVLVITPVTYFTSRGLMFNHNTAQLACVSAAIWLLWRAVHSERSLDWGFLGIACACGFLTKYSMVVHFAAFACYLIYSKKILNASVIKGLVISALVFGVLVTPHFIWLSQHPVNPISYAKQLISPAQAPDFWSNTLAFLSGQLVRLLPMAIAVIVIKWLLMQPQERFFKLPSPSAWGKMSSDAQQFVTIVGLAPIVLVSCIAFALNLNLVSHWASTFFMLYGFFVLAWLHTLHTNKQLKRMLGVIAAVHLIGALGYGFARGPLAISVGRDTRSIFPAQKLANQVDALWRSKQSHPLAIVSSDIWTGGNVVMNMKRKPKLLIDGEMAYSPSVSAAVLRDCAMLVLVNPQESSSTKVAQRLSQAIDTGTMQLVWNEHPQSPTRTLQWGIVVGADPQASHCQPSL